MGAAAAASVDMATGKREASRRLQPGHKGSRPLILVVEDDPHDWEIYGKILWYNGYDCMYARTGRDALELAARHRPALVVMDIGLPDVDGLRLCRLFRGDSGMADVPVLFLTAHAVRDYGKRAAEAGCSQYIEKPARPVDVLHAVEALVGRAPLAGEGRPPRLRGVA